MFWRSFTGGACTVKEWYTRAVPGAIRGLTRPMLLISIIALIGILVGFSMVEQFSRAGQLPGQWTSIQNPRERIHGLINEWPLFSGGPVISIWWQNIRALILGMILGIFSIGILGVLPIFATMALMGGLMNILQQAGIPIGLYLAGMIMPHGILEIPAAILATAAVFQAGAVLATPSQEKTVGEVWIATMGEWAKIMVGIVIPLLLVAAGVEAWVTPRIAFLLFG